MRRIAGAIAVVICAAVASILGAGTAHATVRYDIHVTTCNVNNAGTDANVEGKIFGTNGETGWSVLDNPGDDREKGRTDHYGLDLADVGPVRAISLSFDHAGDSPDWCLSRVVIDGPHGSTTHPYNNWLTDPMTITLVAL